MNKGEPAAIRYHRKVREPALWLDRRVQWDDYGLVLRDEQGEEHHFGLRDYASGGIVFTFVATYTPAGRDDGGRWTVSNKLEDGGFEIVDATLGPNLSPLARIALVDLAEFSIRKGFAFDEERALAVQVFGALAIAEVSFAPDEVYVWGATHGFEWKDADMLKEYAYRAISGGGTRSVAGRAIRVDRGVLKR